MLHMNVPEVYWSDVVAYHATSSTRPSQDNLTKKKLCEDPIQEIGKLTMYENLVVYYMHLQE